MPRINTATGANRDCEGFSRRDFLRVGGLGHGDLALPNLLAARAPAADSKVDLVGEKAVVLLYTYSGASHIQEAHPIPI
tara:strand:+ start:1160 stop:1396 length:237 start_codon:yes stop_codon:yes gene_type:complete